MPVKSIKLNLGCGANKIDGFVNIDSELGCKPDKVCNFITSKLPYKDGIVEEVVLFHTIEHIGKRFHGTVLSEIWRVLRPGGSFMVAYPEFTKCYQNWKLNHVGKKVFWEATIFGRQLYPSDFHVCIMHTPDFVEVLESIGFIKITSKAEPIQNYNTIIKCVKGKKVPSYEDLIKQDMSRFKIVRTGAK